jgi:CheY-like chemotaxis protein
MTKRQGHFLVAEDQPVNKTVIKNYLENFGFSCELSGNGEEAVAAYTREPERFDLILMDCQMPVMNGFEATLKIRQFEKSKGLIAIPIIAFTSESQLEIQGRSHEAGMNGFLAKPLNSEKFSQMISYWLQKEVYEDALDIEVLLKMASYRSGQQSLDLTLVSEFLNSVPAQLLQLSEALAAQDNGKLASVAHGLKSVCFTVGLKPMGRLCETLEKEAQNSAGTHELVQNIIDAEIKATAALQDYALLKTRQVA